VSVVKDFSLFNVYKLLSRDLDKNENALMWCIRSFLIGVFNSPNDGFLNILPKPVAVKLCESVL